MNNLVNRLSKHLLTFACLLFETQTATIQDVIQDEKSWKAYYDDISFAIIFFLS